MNMDLSTVSFGVGTHPRTDAPTGDRDLCIMEAVAYMAGEPWTDSPACASPVISAFLRSWNDLLADDDRDRLLPAAVWVPRLVGSRGDDATEERRAYLALDWLIRVHTPAWFDLAPSLAMHAAALRALPEVVDRAAAEASKDVVDAAWAAAGDAARAAAWAAAGAAAGDAARAAAGAAAWAAAWAAAGDAAWAAAGDAARAAARAAAWAAVWAAAGDAAWAAAGDAAWDAAGGAARAAAWAAIRPTVTTLQQSAVDLLDRMLACGEHRREEGA
jgi:hypothetical protein